MNARQCALAILEDFETRHASLDSIIDSVLARDDMDRRDRRLVFEIVYGVVRNRLRIDFVLDAFLEDAHFREHRQLKLILEIGAYQIMCLDKIPDHAAVNEAVMLAKKNKQTQQFTGVVNAVLRKIIASKNKLPKPADSEPLEYRLSIGFSHPQWLVKRWLKQFGLGNTKKLLEFNNLRPLTQLRRKIKGLQKNLFEEDIRTVCEVSKGGNGYKNLYYTLQKQVLPEDLHIFKEGHCTVQAELSGWVTALLDVKEDDTIVDICAAPGGKATLAAELAGNRGQVIACELRFARLMQLHEAVVRMNLPNISLLSCDGTKLPFSKPFKKILLDAPCTGSGVLHCHPDGRWFRTVADVERMAVIQENLLEAVAPFIAINGILVYATCSLEHEENHDQIKKFLEKHKEFVLENARPFVKETYIDVDGYLTILPFEHKMDGMFAARLRRIN